MAPYRAGIIGLSWITADPAGPATHPALGTATPYSHAAAYAALPNVEVVAGCDIAPEAAAQFHARWQERWPGLHIYGDAGEMLRAKNLDVLSVVTPDHLHTPFVLAGIEAGVKAIFCEKPLATNLEDADAMIAAARERGVVVSVNHTRRWMPSYVAARERVRAGAIGELSQITAHIGGPRAMLFRNHSHLLDLICFFAEAEPSWVIAELEPGFEDYGTVYRGDGGHEPSTEPGLNAYIAFENGVRAFLSGWKRGVATPGIDLIGATGRIRADDASAVRIAPDDDGPIQQAIVPRASRAGMHAAIADLLDALEEGTSPLSPPTEARRTVALMLAILESQARGNVPVEVG